MAARRTWILSVALLAACSEATQLAAIDPTLPDDVVWVGALLERDGVVIASTGLARRGSGGAAQLEFDDKTEATSVRVIGFTKDAFVGLGVSDTAVVPTMPLVVAAARDPVLPAPAFVAAGRLVDGVAKLSATTDAMELTVGWLPACPKLLPIPDKTLGAVACGPLPCDPVVEQVGCEIFVDTQNCRLGTLRGTIDGRGNVVYEDGERLGRCTSTPAARGARLSLACRDGDYDRCRIDAFERPFPERFEIFAVPVVNNAATVHDTSLRRPSRDYLGSVVAAGDEIAVATFDGSIYDNKCTTGQPGTIVFVAPDTGVVLRRRTVPNCTKFLAEDPGRNGFLALYGGRRNLQLGRFDADANIVRSTFITDTKITTEYAPIGIAVSPSSGRVAVGMSWGDQTDYSRVLIYDLDTFDKVAVSQARLRSITDIAPSGLDHFIVADDKEGIVYQLDSSTARVTNDFLVRVLVGGVNVDLARLAQADDRVIVTNTGEEPAMFVFSFDNPAGGVDYDKASTTTYYEGWGEPFALARWPADPALWLVGVTERVARPRPAYIALFDPTAPNFLPGALQVGHGQISDMATDKKGRIWLAMGWTGRLVRVSPLD